MMESKKGSGDEFAAVSSRAHPLPCEYPADLERDVVAGELRYRIRAIVPEDAQRLVVFHSRLSAESRYLRFFGHHPMLSPEEVANFTCVDYSRRMALVAVSGDRIIGVGRYEREPGTDRAEVAFVVADDVHRHGIATLLLDQLVVVARRRGITTFVAHTMWENHDMLSVFFGSGFDVLRRVESGVVTLQFPIRQTTTSRWVLAMRDADRQVTPHVEGVSGQS